MAGGKLHQHVNNHGGDHRIKTIDGRVIEVNSTHHQMQIPPKDARLLAWASPSRHFDQDYKEAECVDYPSINAVGVQYHPEWLDKNSKGFLYCKELIDNLLQISGGIMTGRCYTIIKTDTHEVRGSIFMPIEEAMLFHCTPLGILLKPNPREVDPKSEGWIDVQFRLPPAGDEVKVWGLSECNETAILRSPRPETHPGNIFERNNIKYIWASLDGKNSVWNHKLITHWKPLR